MLENIQWLGHDTFKLLDGDRFIYTDPFQIADGADKADFILITHDHFDHCSPEDVAKIQKDSTVIVAPASCADKLEGDVRTVKAGDRIEVNGAVIEVTWAYNVNKYREPGKHFHPKSQENVGYIFTANGQRVYLAGDTDLIPEMKGIDVDIALVPVSGIYVMTPEEAAQAANTAIKAKVFVPMHYAAIVGTADDAARFARGVQGARVEVLERATRR